MAIHTLSESADLLSTQANTSTSSEIAPTNHVQDAGHEKQGRTNSAYSRRRAYLYRKRLFLRNGGWAKAKSAWRRVEDIVDGQCGRHQRFLRYCIHNCQ